MLAQSPVLRGFELFNEAQNFAPQLRGEILLAELTPLDEQSSI